MNDSGRRQAAALSQRLKRFDVAGVHSSPRERTVETASVVAEARNVRLEIHPELDEVDFGFLTGSTFESLNHDPCWRRWNSARSQSRPPGGETMREAQERIVSHLHKLHETHLGKCIVLVTHAEIIRAAILHVAGLSLDQWSRIEVPPASVTRLQMRSRTHSIATLSGSGIVA